MATIKVKFRPSSIPSKEGVLYYQIIHNRVTRQIRTRFKLHPDEWNEEDMAFDFSNSRNNNRQHYLISLKEKVSADLARLEDIVDTFEQSGVVYTADQIVQAFSTPIENREFLEFTRRLIEQLNQIGKRRTAETYATTLNSFVRFRDGQEIGIDQIDSNVMVAYEIYLKASGLCPNTTSFYMRNLRAIYNRAVEQGFTMQRYPFRHVYTGIDKTVKRAVPLKIIRQIRDLDLRMNPSLDYARDIFMFSFYTRGMSFVDMAFLRKKDIQNGILSYRRQKTNQRLFTNGRNLCKRL